VRIGLSLLLLYCYGPTVAQQPVYYNYRSNNGLSSNEVYKIKSDPKGYLWMATDRGICRFDGSQFTTYSVNDGLEENVVGDVKIAPNGDVWALGSSKKLYRYTGTSFQPYRYNHLLQDAQLVSPSSYVSDFSFEHNEPAHFSLRGLGIIHIDSTGQLRHDTSVAPVNHLVYCPEWQLAYFYRSAWYNKLHIQSKPRFIFQNKWYDYEHITMMHIIRRRNGHVVMSLNRQVFELRGGQLIQTLKYEHFISGLYEDEQQQLWVTTYGSGVRMYPPMEPARAENERVFFGNIRISNVTQDREGGYWFSSYENGVFYVPRLDIQSIQPSLLQSNEVFQELVAVNASLFAATSQGRVLQMGPGGKWQLLFSDPNPNGSSNCNDLVYDANRHHLLLCLSKGIFDININSRKTGYYGTSSRSALPTPQGLLPLSPKFLVSEQRVPSATMPLPLTGIHLPEIAFCIGRKPDGSIIIGTEKGFCTIADGRAVPLHPQLLTKRVTNIRGLANSWLVASTLGAGLALLGPNNQLLLIKLGNSNSFNMVNDIAVEGNTAWAATEAGVVKVGLDRPEQPLVQLLPADNRFPYNNIRKIAHYNQQVVVLAQNQLIQMPAINRTADIPPPISLQRITINDSLVLPFTQPVKLSSNSKRLKFEFNGICFTCGSSIQYRYRLLGLHSEWYTTGQPYVEYPSLEAGSYTFEVEAVNNSGVASAEPASFSFSIRSPLWQKNWFRVMALLLGVTLLGWLIYRRIKTIQRRNQQREWLLAKEQVALSAQINPHFIFNSLNSIQHLIIREDRQQAVLHMAQFSRLMRLSLDNSRKKWVPVADEIELLRLYLDLESLRFKDKFVYTVEADKSLLDGTYRIPAMLIQPFVENAVLHGVNNLPDGRGMITVSLRLQDGVLQARIADNGVGRAAAAKLRQQAVHHISAGMQITEQRLQLLCRETHTPWMFTTIDNTDAEGQPTGTTVFFNMPWLQAAKNNLDTSIQ
jgi:hypothetical protein